MNASFSPPEPKASTKPRPAFWIKVPAILAILFCLVLGGALLSWNPTAIGVRYQAAAEKALADKDYAKAIVASLRLLDLGDSFQNQARFKLALAYLGLGRIGEASASMELVAPTDKPVYAPAHLFVAKTLISRPDQSQRVREAAVAQLRNVLLLEPDSVEAKELLSRFPDQN